MSQIQLAELLDRLNDAERAVLVESPEQVSISNLSASAAVSVLKHVQNLEWKCAASDAEDNAWDISEISDDFAPFRVEFTKNINLDQSLFILTNSGFANFLQSGHSATVWRVARIHTVIKTQSRIFAPWEHEEPFVSKASTKSPRALVRETTAQRSVPDSIQPWIISDENYLFACEASKIWADVCIAANVRAIPDEIEPIEGNLKFKGPPRLTLTSEGLVPGLFEKFGCENFTHLQRVVGWIYENEREAEVRHLLFSAELARSGGGTENVLSRLKRDGVAAFEGAKIAYQMSISDLGKDTLKTLADLKKSVTEDTAKVTDATRQTIGAVATALAVGLGLLAARAATATEPWLICSVMFIVVLYVLAIINSGCSFIKLQQQLRKDWQPRLYRFLSNEDYSRMVGIPSANAERTFFWTAWIGGGSISVLFFVFLYIGLSSGEEKSVGQKESTKLYSKPVSAASNGLAVRSTSQPQIPLTADSKTVRRGNESLKNSSDTKHAPNTRQNSSSTNQAPKATQ